MQTITHETATRLRELATLIELEDRFRYNYWIGQIASDGQVYQGPAYVTSAEEIIEDCNTTGCIAGWAVGRAFQEGRLTDQDATLYFGAEAWVGLGAKALGLAHDQARDLFFSGAAIQLGYAERCPDDCDGRPEDAEAHRCWADVSAVEAAKMLRQIADGDLWPVVD